MAPYTLIEMLEAELDNDSSFVTVTAHAALVKGNVVNVVISTGLTEAPGNNDRLLFAGVATESIASGAVGRVKIKGLVQVLSGAAITMGQQLDCSADMFADPAGTQTDGNCFATALESTASGAGELIWVKLK